MPVYRYVAYMVGMILINVGIYMIFYRDGFGLPMVLIGGVISRLGEKKSKKRPFWNGTMYERIFVVMIVIGWAVFSFLVVTSPGIFEPNNKNQPAIPEPSFWEIGFGCLVFSITLSFQFYRERSYRQQQNAVIPISASPKAEQVDDGVRGKG